MKSSSQNNSSIRHLLPLLAGVSLLLFIGCEQTNPSGASFTPLPGSGKPLARVNGAVITEDSLELLERTYRGANFTREGLLGELIKRELLYQEAVQKNLLENADVVRRLDTARRSILSQAAVEDIFANAPVSEQDIQKVYDATYSADGSSEYKARHILLKTRERALEIVSELQKGGDFQTLAKDHSTGPSGPKGGDLGWFGPSQMVGGFADAVVALQNGEFSGEPIQTQFGWHVILREDSRDLTPPAFDSVKNKIQSQLQRKLLDTHLQELQKNATIEIVAETVQLPTDPESGTPKEAQNP